MQGSVAGALNELLSALRAAFNDFARTDVTAGEVEALRADANRAQAENAELSGARGDPGTPA